MPFIHAFMRPTALLCGLVIGASILAGTSIAGPQTYINQYGNGTDLGVTNAGQSATTQVVSHGSKGVVDIVNPNGDMVVHAGGCPPGKALEPVVGNGGTSIYVPRCMYIEEAN